MKWSDLSMPWQVCFEQAWEGFCAGSLPIGAAVLDAFGNLLASGRNHIYDDSIGPNQVSQNQLAHAELNTLLQVDRRSVDVHSCILYTSMEPCPLCMGAIYMSGIRKIAFAARDAYAGSTDMLGTTPYLSRKSMQVIRPQNPILEIIFLGMQLVAENRRLTMIRMDLYETVIGAWREKCPEGVRFGETLAETGWLPIWARDGQRPEWVFESLSQHAANLNKVS